jgi:hypothetical protein
LFIPSSEKIKMDNAVCWKCIEDKYLREIIKDSGEPLLCSVCEGEKQNAFGVKQLGKLIEPILREHFQQGEYDNHEGEQAGDPLSFAVQEVLGQEFDFEDEIVGAVIDAEDVDPQDGEIPFFDDTCNYVSSPISLREYNAEWNSLLQELKYKRRFFSSSAKALFDKLFTGSEAGKFWNEENELGNAVQELPEGSELFRARNCNSLSVFRDFSANPFKQVGPPPAARARSARMNVEGVVVFYGATDRDTCLAEMRPAIGGGSAIITLRTTKALRMLDFTRLEKFHNGKTLSYFQPNFSEGAQKRGFLRRLHSLISQPVIPGRESDYLITQAMTEYLAHVYDEPFDGILFASVQRAGGVNVVLFPERDLRGEGGESTFHLTYVDGSIQLFTTDAIQYTHRKRYVDFTEDGLFVDPDDDLAH